jgi:hypothetical protein
MVVLPRIWSSSMSRMLLPSWDVSSTTVCGPTSRVSRYIAEFPDVAIFWQPTTRIGPRSIVF